MANDDETDERRNKGLLNRRGYLKFAGTTAAALAAAGATTAGVAAANYDEIVLSAGEQRRFSVGDGETFENTLIDVSADGADARITARGDDWTIRNVGFRGTSAEFPNHIYAEGNGVVENCYLGDGVARDNIRKGGLGVGQGHSGHIDVVNCYFGRWTDNAVYAAGMARDSGGGGTLAIDGCYLVNNNVSHLRIASDGTTVENTVIHNTNDVPLYPDGVVNSRGVYTGYGDPEQVVTFRNCDIDVTSSNTNGAASAAVSGTSSTWGPLSTIRLIDSQVRGRVEGHVEQQNVGSEPDVSIPDGVPTDAEAAASGQGSGSGDGTSDGGTAEEGSSEASDHLLAVVTTTDAQSGGYRFLVDGSVEKTTAPYESPSGSRIRAGNNDSITSVEGETYRVEGSSGNGYGDAYAVEGRVYDVEFDEPEQTWLEWDGEEVTPEEIEEWTAPDDSTDDGTSSEDGAGDDTSGDDTSGDDGAGDDTSGDGGSGGDGSGDGSAGDGELTSTIVIDGTRTDEVSKYAFTVDGDVEGAPGMTSVVDGGLPWDMLDDKIEGSRVIGIVGKAKDAYRFDGTITSLEIRGNATTNIERND